jgi:hypothetical protein
MDCRLVVALGCFLVAAALSAHAQGDAVFLRGLTAGALGGISSSLILRWLDDRLGRASQLPRTVPTNPGRRILPRGGSGTAPATNVIGYVEKRWLDPDGTTRAYSRDTVVAGDRE